MVIALYVAVLAQMEEHSNVVDKRKLRREMSQSSLKWKSALTIRSRRIFVFSTTVAVLAQMEEHSNYFTHIPYNDVVAVLAQMEEHSNERFVGNGRERTFVAVLAQMEEHSN